VRLPKTPKAAPNGAPVGALQKTLKCGGSGWHGGDRDDLKRAVLSQRVGATRGDMLALDGVLR
jgi:hypothetical protein